MEYMTVREAAGKWKISERMVQKYCAEGKIEGVRKFGVSWGIPQCAEKPDISQSVKKKENHTKSGSEIHFCMELMPLMNTAFKPGSCVKMIEAMEDGPRKDIALAEYHYFSGQPERAVIETGRYLAHPNMEIRLSGCLIYSYANLSLGQISRARYVLNEMRRNMEDIDSEAVPQIGAAKAFCAAAGAVLLHLPLPEKLPPLQTYLPLLPPGLQAFAFYVQAHYTYLKKEYGKSVGIVETTLAMQQEKYPIPAIYLHLVAVMDYMSLNQPEQAREHLLAAWDLARPDDLIEGFGEHHGLLGGMLEAVIKKRWPEDFKRIIEITYRFSAGWRKVHNPDTGHDVADNLTTSEFAVAMLAARGWTNQEISEHMSISPNTVKHYVSMALQKLHIKRRQDLKKYMLR